MSSDTNRGRAVYSPKTEYCSKPSSSNRVSNLFVIVIHRYYRIKYFKFFFTKSSALVLFT